MFEGRSHCRLRFIRDCKGAFDLSLHEGEDIICFESSLSVALCSLSFNRTKLVIVSMMVDLS